ncbi:MAG: hypothetical protein JXR88_11475 [Clostridia bacterium]|nr:hypothetical protein [Clostridia bacterium]
MFYLGITGIHEFVEFLLIDEEGRIHGWQKEHSVDLLAEGPSVFRGMIESGIARIFLKTGITFSEIDFCILSIPEYGENADFDEILNQVLSSVFYDGNFLCENDLEVALTAAFGLSPGIVVLAGAGSVALGRNRRNDLARTGGWGNSSGDEAGEYWFFRKLIKIFAKQADQRSNSRLFYHHLKSKVPFLEDHEIISLSLLQLKELQISFKEFLYYVLDEEIQLDNDIQALIHEAVDEIILMILGVVKQIDIDEPIRVSFIGRIFHRYFPIQTLVMDELKKGNKEYLFTKPLLRLSTGTALHALTFRKNITIQVIENLRFEEQRLLNLI